jgi:hypothetical protein
LGGVGWGWGGGVGVGDVPGLFYAKDSESIKSSIIKKYWLHFLPKNVILVLFVILQRKSSLSQKTPMISFVKLNEMEWRVTPDKLLFYKHALTLFKLFYGPYYSIELAPLNVNIVLTPRQSQFQINKMNRLKIRANALSNRLDVINGKIPLDWLNLILNSLKIKCKKLFLQ